MTTESYQLLLSVVKALVDLHFPRSEAWDWILGASRIWSWMLTWAVLRVVSLLFILSLLFPSSIKKTETRIS